MKILFVEDSPLVKYGIVPALKRKDIEVKCTNLYIDINKCNYESLIKEINEFKPDALFNLGMRIVVNVKQFINILKGNNVKYIYWAIEDPVDFNTVSLPNAVYADLTLTTTQECISIYRKRGIDAEFMLFGCNEEFHKEGVYDKKFDHDIIFIGNNYSRHYSRNYGNKIMIKSLVDRNYDIKVYGNSWWIDGSQKFTLDEKFYGGYCSYEEIPNAYKTARIIIGMHSVGNSSTMMSMRTFEVLGCKGFYLSQYAPSLQRYFKNKKHLVWCNNSNDTLRNVEYYLENQSKRLSIASNGQKECYLHHKYIDKIDDLIMHMKRRNIYRE